MYCFGFFIAWIMDLFITPIAAITSFIVLSLFGIFVGFVNYEIHKIVYQSD